MFYTATRRSVKHVAPPRTITAAPQIAATAWISVCSTPGERFIRGSRMQLPPTPVTAPSSSAIDGWILYASASSASASASATASATARSDRLDTSASKFAPEQRVSRSRGDDEESADGRQTTQLRDRLFLGKAGPELHIHEDGLRSIRWPTYAVWSRAPTGSARRPPFVPRATASPRA